MSFAVIVFHISSLNYLIFTSFSLKKKKKDFDELQGANSSCYERPNVGVDNRTCFFEVSVSVRLCVCACVPQSVC